MGSQTTRKGKIKRELTPLECITLATVQLLEPCTAYTVRCTFRESHAAWFSDSAGSIYPLLRRLTAAGLLRSRADQDDQRGRAELFLTAAGRTATRDWLLAASEAQVDTFDPLRTRGRFLSLLAKRDRVAWLRRQQAALAAQRELIEAQIARDWADDELFARLAHEHALEENRGRSRWLRKVERVLREGAG